MPQKYRFINQWGITASLHNDFPYHETVLFNPGDIVSGYMTSPEIVTIKIPAELAPGVMGTMNLGIPRSLLAPIVISSNQAPVGVALNAHIK